MSYLVNFINSIHPISESCKKEIEKITTKKVIQKGDIILRNGEICEHFYLIESGFGRVFYYKDGKDVTAWFANETMIVSAIDSLFTGLTTDYNIEFLEDSIIWTLHYASLEPIFNSYPEIERIGRLLITHNYLLLDERMKLFAFCSAEERYDRLIQQMPDVFKRAKLGNIASYLGISQEHLSRIRAKTK